MSAPAMGLSLAVAALVLALAWLRRPAPARARALASAAGAIVGAPIAGMEVVAGRSSKGRDWTGRLGGLVRTRVGLASEPGADRHLGRALFMAVPAAAVSPVLLVGVGLWWWIVPPLRRRREQARRDAVLLAELPEVVDLFVLAVGAGMTVPLAVSAVARHHRGAIGTALVDVSRRVALGARQSDALADLAAAAGDRLRPLVSALIASDRYGVALLPALERLAAESRLQRRRAAEASARRIPVKLLFPLVLCTLPAFALLTVVPLLAGSLRTLRL